MPPEAWTHGRSRDLVKLLALAPRHRLPRERVVDELWPRLDAEAGLANLHKAGELLPDDPYAAWTQDPRARLRSRYIDGLRAAERWEALAVGRFSPASDRAAPPSAGRARLRVRARGSR